MFGERIGRKRMILAGGSIMVLGTILLGSSYSVPQLLVGRVVTGLGNGFNSATVPMYRKSCMEESGKHEKSLLTARCNRI